MIEVSNLTKLYGERKVLHGLTFSVEVGRVCGFLGPNGSGKSTTMDILAGLLGPSDGQVRVCGIDVVSKPREVKALVGYLPDNPPLYKEMIVRDFVDYVAKLHGLSGNSKKIAIERVLSDCDVTDVASRIIGNLSKGYRQRVALCSALVHNPRVLILDEPTEGLDPNQILQIRSLIKKLATDRTVIMSSHILSEIQSTCAEVIIINKGRIAAKATVGEGAEKNPAYIFSFNGSVSAAQSWLSDRSFVQQVVPFQERKNSLLVNFSKEFWAEGGENSIALVIAQVVQEGFKLTGVQEHSTGLESLFFDVIKSQGAEIQAQ